MPGRIDSVLERSQTWLRCRVKGHRFTVQQFDYHSHLMTLTCDRCGETQTTTIVKVKLDSTHAVQPRVSEH